MPRPRAGHFLLAGGLLLACSPDSDRLDDSAEPLDTSEDLLPGEPDEGRLLGHVRVLASDEYGGREPGTEGGDLASAYVEAHFSSLGLAGAGDDGGFRHGFPLQNFVQTGPSELVLGGTEYEEGPAYQLFTYSGSGDVEGELVFVGYGLTVPPFDAAAWPDCPLDPAGYDDYLDLDLSGKVALVMRHGPNEDQAIMEGCPVNEAGVSQGDLFAFGYKAANAALHGASAMLLFTDFSHEEGEASGGTLGQDYYDESMPAVFVARGLLQDHLPDLRVWQELIDSTLQPGGRETGVQVQLHTETAIESITAHNMLATIPGSDPDIGHEVVLVGAHFDHVGTDPSGEIYNGADDNASGTATMLELAQLWVESGIEPARTMVFAGFNAEELGLIGSMYYVIDPVFALEDTVAMINLDMVGGGDDLGLLDFGGTDSGSEWLYELLAAQQDEDFPITPLGASYNSDHAWFQSAGVPIAFLFTVGEHGAYHTPADTYDTISGYELERTASQVWTTTRTLAMGEEDQVEQRTRPAAPPAAALEIPSWLSVGPSWQ